MWNFVGKDENGEALYLELFRTVVAIMALYTLNLNCKHGHS